MIDKMTHIKRSFLVCVAHIVCSICICRWLSSHVRARPTSVLTQSPNSSCTYYHCHLPLPPSTSSSPSAFLFTTIINRHQSSYSVKARTSVAQVSAPIVATSIEMPKCPPSHPDQLHSFDENCLWRSVWRFHPKVCPYSSEFNHSYLTFSLSIMHD